MSFGLPNSKGKNVWWEPSDKTRVLFFEPEERDAYAPNRSRQVVIESDELDLYVERYHSLRQLRDQSDYVKELIKTCDLLLTTRTKAGRFLYQEKMDAEGNSLFVGLVNKLEAELRQSGRLASKRSRAEAEESALGAVFKRWGFRTNGTKLHV
jgi:hypothetical protein